MYIYWEIDFKTDHYYHYGASNVIISSCVVTLDAW